MESQRKDKENATAELQLTTLMNTVNTWFRKVRNTDNVNTELMLCVSPTLMMQVKHQLGKTNFAGTNEEKLKQENHVFTKVRNINKPSATCLDESQHA